jgi:hypothetical protein
MPIFLFVVIMMPTQSSTVHDASHGFIRHGNIRWLVESVIARWFFATHGSTMDKRIIFYNCYVYALNID